MKNIIKKAFVTIFSIAFGVLFSAVAFAEPPANDNIRGAELLGTGLTLGAHVTGSNVEATTEKNEPSSNNLGAGATIWYKWTAPADPRPMQITMHRSAIPVLISVYRSEPFNTMELVTRDNRSPNPGTRAHLIFFPQSNTTYYFSVDGKAGATETTGQIGLDLAPATIRQANDFDFDGKSDISVFRPSEGVWYTYTSMQNFLFARQWGISGDFPLAAEFNIGQPYRQSDYAVFRPSTGTWYITSDNLATPPRIIGFGQSGDIPVTGNFVGSGTTDIGVFRPSNATWYFQTIEGTNLKTVQFGQPGDVPMAGDWDTDSVTDTAVFRPLTGDWHIQSSQYGAQTLHWGKYGDAPVRGDFDGDGINDLAVFRPEEGNWYVHRSSDANTIVVRWGLSGDVPVSGDYDGDGKTDFALFRQSDGTWYIILSGSGQTVIQKWGLPGDRPVSENFYD